MSLYVLVYCRDRFTLGNVCVDRGSPCVGLRVRSNNGYFKEPARSQVAELEPWKNSTVRWKYSDEPRIPGFARNHG